MQHNGSKEEGKKEAPSSKGVNCSVVEVRVITKGIVQTIVSLLHKRRMMVMMGVQSSLHLLRRNTLLIVVSMEEVTVKDDVSTDEVKEVGATYIRVNLLSRLLYTLIL